MRSRHMLLTAAALLLSTSCAFAQDAADFARKLSASFATSGFNIEFGPATSSGGTIEFDGATLTSPALAEVTGNAEPLELDASIVFSGVQALPDGGYSAEKLTTSDIIIPATEGSLLVSNVAANGIYVPAVPTITSQARQIASASIGPISFNAGGKSIISIERLEARSNFDAPQWSADLDKITTLAELKGIRIDLSDLKDPQADKMLDALNLRTINGSFEQTTNWSLKSGDLSIPENRLTLEGVGAIDVPITIAGYTADVVQQLETLQKAYDAGDKTVSEEESAAIQQIAGAIALKSVAIRFENLGIVDRIFEMAAKESGTSRNDYVQRMGSLAPFLLQSIIGQDLAAAAAPAVNEFMLNPRSLVISLTGHGRGAAVSDIVSRIEKPESLLELTDISISANK